MPFGHRHIGRVVVRRGEGTEAGLCQPHTLDRHVGKIIVSKTRFENDGTGMHAHAAWAVILERFARRDRERLDPRWIARPTRHVHFRCADAGRDAAMDIAFEEADRLLPGRVVAERDVDVGVDQTGHRHHTGRINGDVGICDIAAATDRGDLVAVDEDGVTGRDWLGEITRENCADIEDRKLHRVSLTSLPCAPRLPRG